MQVHELNVRPARPSPDDGERFAQYLNVAADGLFQWMLGSRWAEIIGNAFLTPGHDLSYEHVSFAETRSGVAGMISGYTSADHARSSNKPLEKAAGISRLRLWAAGVLASPVLSFIDRLDDGDWYLQAVAVDPTQRGQGIGSALLDHAETTARATGSQRLVLDVAVDNEAARILYERRGMAIEARSRSLPLIANSAVYRMAKILTDPRPTPTPH